MSAADLETLGLAKGATPAQVKAAYHRLAAEHHPDRGGDRDRFEAVCRAYKRLRALPCPKCKGKKTVPKAQGFRTAQVPRPVCRGGDVE